MEPLTNILNSSLAIVREQVETHQRTTDLAIVVLAATGYESYFFAPIDDLPYLLERTTPQHAAQLGAHIASVSRLTSGSEVLIDIITWAGHATFRAPILSLGAAPMVGPAEPRTYDALPNVAKVCANLQPVPTEVEA